MGHRVWGPGRRETLMKRDLCAHFQLDAFIVGCRGRDSAMTDAAIRREKLGIDVAVRFIQNGHRACEVGSGRDVEGANRRLWALAQFVRRPRRCCGTLRTGFGGGRACAGGCKRVGGGDRVVGGRVQHVVPEQWGARCADRRRDRKVAGPSSSQSISLWQVRATARHVLVRASRLGSVDTRNNGSGRMRRILPPDPGSRRPCGTGGGGTFPPKRTLLAALTQRPVEVLQKPWAALAVGDALEYNGRLLHRSPV